MTNYNTLLLSLEKKKLIAILVAGTTALLICLIVAPLKAPIMKGKQTETFKKCDSTQAFNCISTQNEQEFYLKIREVKKENNFLYLEIVPKFRGKPKELDLRYYFDVKDDNDDTVKSSNRTETFRDGDAAVSYFISYAKHEEYRISLKFYDSLENIIELEFRISFVNAGFFEFVKIVKYFFFTFTLCGILLFFYKTRAAKFRYMQFETINLLLMNFSLLIFNEPLFAAYTSSPVFGLTSTAISVFCNVQFICALIMFWLFMLKKLNNPYCKNIIKLIEFIFICSLFSFLFVIYVYVESDFKFDSNYDWKENLKNEREIIYNVLITLLVLFATWMMVLMAISLRKWREKGFCTRQKVYWAINYAIIIITFIFIGLGFIRKMQIGSILLSVISLYNIYFSILLFLSIPDMEEYKKWVDQTTRIKP